MRLRSLEELGGFPPASSAFREPNGLLCAGGDLEPNTLLAAYAQGIFPWYSLGDPILWWTPDPRMILALDGFTPSRSLRKVMRRRLFTVSLDRCFERVIRACAKPREHEPGDGTWIIDEMIDAYCELHRLGHAHSVEVWRAGELVGGLYGVSLGRQFFGESMFSLQSNTSKIGLATLAEQLRRWGFRSIDCQLNSDHLASLGGEEIEREEFLRHIAAQIALPFPAGAWELDGDLTLEQTQIEPAGTAGGNRP